MNPTSPLWNSLEVAKIVISVGTPVIVLVVGYWIHRSLKRIEQLQWSDQRITEKRLEIFDELAPLLNDLFCYFTYVGCWKELTPPDVVKLKRRTDRIVYVNAPLFSPTFLATYTALIDECFQSFMGWGVDAKLRTKPHQRRNAAGSKWDDEWDQCFSAEVDAADPKRIKLAHKKLMASFVEELRINSKS